MKNKSLLALCLLSVSALCSACASSESSSYSNSYSYSHISQEETGFHKDTNRNCGTNWGQIAYGTGASAVPSTGTVNILVLPIEFTDFAFSSGDAELMRIGFSGTASETRYWESVRSYYEKSSYGQLNLSFTIAETCSMGMNSSTFYSRYQKSDNYGGAAMEKAVAQYKSIHGSSSTKKFDNDGDGYIDGVIMIYSAPDCVSSSKVAYDTDCWWAYTYYDLNEVSYNLESPNGYHYIWASIDFFYTFTKSRSLVDSHTLIHEFGHLLGTGDYYDPNGEKSPCGRYDMMDENVLDHDSMTKMSYGWMDPFVVDDSCSITIEPYETSGDCIVLANDWNETAWDEYLVLELYTSDSNTLNYLDTKYNYQNRGCAYGGFSWLGKSVTGVRMWHVDSRVALASRKQGSSSLTFSSFMSDEMIRGETKVPSDKYWDVAFTNGASQIIKGAGSYNFLSLVSARQQSFDDETCATDEDLFVTGDTWTLTSTDPAFTNGAFDNGEALPYRISFSNVSETSATISFEKLA